MDRNNFVGTFASVQGRLLGVDELFIDKHLYNIGPIKINPSEPMKVKLTFHEDTRSKVLQRMVDLDEELKVGGAVEFKITSKTYDEKKVVRNIILVVDSLDIDISDFAYHCEGNLQSKLFVTVGYSTVRVETFEVKAEDDDYEDDEVDDEYEW